MRAQSITQMAPQKDRPVQNEALLSIKVVEVRQDKNVKIMVDGKIITAQSDTALKEGVFYNVRLTTNADGQVTLHVADRQAQVLLAKAEALQTLLQLPTGSAVRNLLFTLLEKGIDMSHQVKTLLQQHITTGTHSEVKAFQHLLQANIPIQKESMQALITLQSDVEVAATLANVMKDQGLPTHLKTELQTVLQKLTPEQLLQLPTQTNSDNRTTKRTGEMMKQELPLQEKVTQLLQVIQSLSKEMENQQIDQSKTGRATEQTVMEQMKTSIKSHPTLTTDERPFVQAIVQYSQGNRLTTEKLATHIQTFLQQTQHYESSPVSQHKVAELTTLLGLEQEHTLREQITHNVLGKSEQLPLQSGLKQLLLQIAEEQNIAPETKVNASKVVEHLTAQQLVNHENKHDLFLQFPLWVNNTLQECTMSYQGKKDEEGTFDPEYCKIAFFLSLESIGAVGIHLNVQRKSVQMRIYNAWQGIQHVGGALESGLQKRLESHGYTLSSVSWHCENPKQD
ncbi:MAG: hypothetical protein ACRCWQ_12210, partial [Bacilli bacterium]